ncbi:MAG: dihydrofolate reductase family protein [Solirubrobacteraceae bacterium]
MRPLSFSMTVSLDGFIAGPGGEIDWSAPDEELHRFHNEQTRELGAHLCGRGLYETMVYWETADQDPALAEHTMEFARIWQDLPKIVFSKTLEAVEGNATLVRDGIAEEVARLKAEPGKDLAAGGAGLAAGLTELGLIDEYRLFVSPVVLGGGTPFFPPLDARIELELVETRTFSSRVVYLRYRRAVALL